jgi:hypothetical protein
MSGVDGLDTAFVATWTVNGKEDAKRTIAFMSEQVFLKFIIDTMILMAIP